MKKIYQKPMMMAYNVQTASMLCGSITGNNIDGLTMGGGTNGTDIVEGNARRSYSVWGDDEEEDF